MLKSGFKRKGGFKGRSKGLKKTTTLKKKRKKRKRPSDPKSQAIASCDQTFSMLVRIMAANNRGICSCYTCGKKGFWKKNGIQCGHYKSRSHYSIRWDLKNAKPQCINCNQVLSGNIEIYRKKLSDEFGETLLQELEDKSKMITDFNIDDIKRIRKSLKKKLDKIREQRGL